MSSRYHMSIAESAIASGKKSSSLPFHQIDIADVNGIAPPVDSNNRRQRYGCLGSRNGDDEDGENLACQQDRSLFHWIKIGKGNQRNIDGIEHNFNAHQHRNRVPARERSKQPDAKEHRAQYQKVAQGQWIENRGNVVQSKWHHSSSPPAAMAIAPMIATSKTRVAISKGNT